MRKEEKSWRQNEQKERLLKVPLNWVHANWTEGERERERERYPEPELCPRIRVDQQLNRDEREIGQCLFLRQHSMKHVKCKLEDQSCFFIGCWLGRGKGVTSYSVKDISE